MTTQHRIGLFLVCLFAVLPAGPAYAQGGGPLRFDGPVTSTLAEGATHAYTFHSDGGQSLTISMSPAETSRVDPVLELYDPAGVLVAFNDDSAPERPDASLQAIALDSAGVYTLMARSYGNRGAGAYTLTATLKTTQTLNATAPIAMNSAIDSEIFVGGQIDRWAFTGAAGQVISIAMNRAPGSQLDPLIELTGPMGVVLAYSDDDGGDANSLINGFPLPQDGGYLIVARSWGNASTGEYTLQLVEGILEPTTAVYPPTTPDSPSTRVATTSQAGNITPGQPVTGTIRAGAIEAWTLAATTGDTYSVALYAEAGEFDPLLTLVNDQGRTVASDDDSGASFNSLLRGWVVPADGLYTVRVSSYRASGSGAYTLIVEPGSRFLLPESWQQGELPPDTVIERRFEGTGAHVWHFAGLADQQYVLEYSGMVAAEVLTVDGDSVGNVEPGQRFALPEDGRYTIIVYGYDTATYTLSLAEVEPPRSNTGSIAPGQNITTALAAGAQDEWTFTGEAGQLVSIALYAQEGSLDPVLSVLDAHGREAAFDDDGGIGVNSIINGWELPLDGPYVIHVRSFSPWQTGRYQLIMEAGNRFILPDNMTQGTVAAGEMVEGIFLPDSPVHVWLFDAAVGERLQIETSGPVQIVEILDEEGYSEGTVAEEEPVTFHGSGLHHLVLEAAEPGPYTLKLEAVSE